MKLAIFALLLAGASAKSSLVFEANGASCNFAFAGKVLTTDCSLDAGFKGTAPKSVSGDAQLVFEEADGSKCAMAYTGGKVVTNCNLGKGFQTDRPCNADGSRQTDRSDFGKSWGTPVSISGNYRSNYQGGWRFWGGGLENGVNQFQDDYVRVHYKKQ